MKALSDLYNKDLEEFIQLWTKDLENKILKVSWTDKEYKYGEVLRHVIVHEIHHIGQLLIWARELNLQPVSANLIIDVKTDLYCKRKSVFICKKIS